MNIMTVSPAPHIHDGITTRRIMLDVIIALCPALITGIVIFGRRAALVAGVCITACVLCEWIFRKALNRKNTVTDLSAALTGLLLALNLPVSIPIWQVVFGCIVAIVLVKQLFGGLGKNFANPAITARIVMFLAFASSMTNWVMPFDTVTGATPLMLMARGDADALPGLRDLFLGLHGGCIGETSELALLLGGIYLLCRKVISWHTPAAFIGVVFVMTALLGMHPVQQIFSGGLMLGAIFMATDYVTTPYTKSGRLIFGAGAGLITVLIRVYGSYPEGVSFGILFMNMLVSYINRLTAKKALGGIF